MSSELLGNTRTLNKILQATGPDGVVFSDLTHILSQILDANVFVISRRGRILGMTTPIENSSQPYEEVDIDEFRISDEYNNELLGHTETQVNTRAEGDNPVFVSIIPVHSALGRLGTLVLELAQKEMTTEDIILAEYSATIVGMEIMRSKSEEIGDQTRKKEVVQMALGTLSYSETEAIKHIFAELNSMEGLLVASKIADRAGITRSVIVNALRKLESAGVIESRSLGMKGTHIKVLNDELPEELEKIK